MQEQKDKRAKNKLSKLHSVSNDRPFDLERTHKIAAMEASKASAGDVFLLIGDLGAGKSTFAKFFIEALGLEYQGSPTFGYLNYYQNPELLHIDMYNHGKAIIQEILENRDAILLIEWPSEAILSMFKNVTKLKFHFDGVSRWIERSQE